MSLASFTSLSTLLRKKSTRPKFMTRAGQAHRVDLGKPRSGNESGPMHDLSDFHYIDGTLPSLTQKQKIWMEKRECIQQRIDRLGREMIGLHLEWQEYDEIAEKESQEAEDKKQ